MYPGEILLYLAAIEKAVNAVSNNDDLWVDGAVVHTSVTWHGDHLATLYEEGWDFEQPKEKE